MVREIFLREINHMPIENEFSKDLKWVCESLGLSSGRDIEGTSFKVLYEFLGRFGEEALVSSESIARDLALEQSRVNHHFRNFIDSGILLREKRKVTLRGGSLTSAIKELQRDSEKMFERLLEVSRRIDEQLDL